MRYVKLAASNKNIGDVDVSSIAPGDNNIGNVDIASMPIADLTPTVTLYSPSTTAYVKVIPDEHSLGMEVRATNATGDAMYFAGHIVHKIADTANVITEENATGAVTMYALGKAIVASGNAHLASTTYHNTASPWPIIPGHKIDDTVNVCVSANMTTIQTGYNLAIDLSNVFEAHIIDETVHISGETPVVWNGPTPTSGETLITRTNDLRYMFNSHFANDVAHGGADLVNDNNYGVPATTGDCQTQLNALKLLWNSHVAIANCADLAGAAAVANSALNYLTLHVADSVYSHGGAADLVAYEALFAGVAASTSGTTNTLLNLEKSAINTHMAVTDVGKKTTYLADNPLEYKSTGTFYARTKTSGGTFTTTEYKSE